MSAASPLPFPELPRVSSRPWLKYSPLSSDLSIRCTPTAKNLVELISLKAADANLLKNPWDTEVRITMDEVRQRLQKSKRCIEYAMEEIGPAQIVRDPKRRQQVKEKTGIETVGKNLVAVRRSNRPGEWFCRILPENWRQQLGEPGGPMMKPPRKRKTVTASTINRLPFAARATQASPSNSFSDSLQTPELTAPSPSVPRAAELAARGTTTNIRKNLRTLPRASLHTGERLTNSRKQLPPKKWLLRRAGNRAVPRNPMAASRQWLAPETERVLIL